MNYLKLEDVEESIRKTTPGSKLDFKTAKDFLFSKLVVEDKDLFNMVSYMSHMVAVAAANKDLGTIMAAANYCSKVPILKPCLDIAITVSLHNVRFFNMVATVVRRKAGVTDDYIIKLVEGVR